LLAAGASTRLGRPKQLARVGGESLLRRAAGAMASARIDEMVVVLGAEADACARELAGAARGRVAIEVVVNPAYREGLSSSLRRGIAPRAGAPAPAAWLVALVDQPGVTTAHLDALLDAFNAGDALASATRHGDTRGAPAVLAAALAGRLESLAGDRGAGPLLAELGRQVVEVECDAAALDVDDEAALRRAVALFPERGSERQP
jgi:CTP:molybdopterin cytidylyltransferase MocA